MFECYDGEQDLDDLFVPWYAVGGLQTVMERPSDTPPMWCNPQTLHRDFDDPTTTLESEVCVL
jgi:hypothetical protein